ncbi:amidohydrolase family protein [Maribacter dokdonensis]|uniref:amidohydrolase family protein n=1 Tax=Maribacter dokdonensis TaxID=320912 RepID=UPI001C0A0809|nr:amidohydrolase family protein [Maribacter dokdonensis]MBU2902069.1 amidohydrolase family protein [Maribacter dokdonensis]
MIIDSHQHYWKYDPVRDSWINDAMKIIQRDFLPSDLKPILTENNVDGCIAVQADQSETETTFLLNLATHNNFIKGVVGWVDLCDNNVKKRLEYFAQNKLFKGVRHILQAEKEDFILDQAFMDGIGELAALNLTYDLLVFPNQLKNSIQLVSKFSNQKFVLDHIAKPPIKLGEINDWKAAITALAKNPNVYCKLSGLTTEANWSSWNISDFTPYIDVVFEAFGTNRIMFGSDWPVCLLAGSYAKNKDIITSYIKQLTPAEQAQVMGLNAMDFYNLNA